MVQRKKTLVWIVSFLLIAGFLITSLASYYTSRSSLRSQITRHELPLTSDNIYSEIQRDLLQPIFISSLMANDTFLRDWVVQGESQTQKIQRYLAQIKSKYNTFTAFFVSDKTGNYYHSGGILKQMHPNEPRDIWYYRVKQMTPEYEINVDPDMANEDMMTIFINFKVHDDGGNFLGATGVGLQVGAVKQLVKKYQTDYDRNICFIDKTGKILINGSPLQKGVETIDGLAGLGPIKEKILAGPRGIFKTETNGNTVHINTRYIPEFDWYLLVSQTEEAATRPILNALLANLGICAIITLVVLVLTHATISTYQRNLEQMATQDKLTGCYNRQAFDLIAAQILKESMRKKTAFSVILFDIDHFKSVNDKYGHLAGDAVIQQMVKAAKADIRGSDVLCRWGGEEFLILLRECESGPALRIAEKIRTSIEATPTRFHGHTIPATISAGVGQYRAGESLDTLISRADNRLYRAKNHGRNRCENSDEPKQGK